MEATIHKEQLSKSLKELAITELDFVKALILEVANDLKRQRLEKIVNEDFAEYEAVFRTLA